MKQRTWELVLIALLLAAAAVPGTAAFAQQQDHQPAHAPFAAAPPAAEETADSKSPPAVKESDPSARAAGQENSVGRSFLLHLAEDQRAIWTSPGRLRAADAEWLFPLSLATAATFAADSKFSKHLSNSPGRLHNSASLSNYGVGALAGLGGGFYFLGQMTHDEHKSETGLLAGEAAMDSFAATYGLKYLFGRDRPIPSGYRGNFLQGGDSFPSEHAAAAWSIASIVAHEYPGPLTEVLAYGLASAVSVSRVTAKQHFSSDVLVGSAIGWLVGRQVYRAHHNSETGGGAWGGLSAGWITEEHRSPTHMGSPYVPLDSWVYRALDRLAALGYVNTSVTGLKSWTRMECARQTEEAAAALEFRAGNEKGAAELVAGLQQEFAREIALLSGGRNLAAHLNSVYARAVSISGPALTDSYHIGQTISYDFGRPFERGFNGQAGLAADAEAGPLAVYVRAEYQHAPGAPPLSLAAREVIALRDFEPVQPAIPVPATNQLQVLEAYAAVNVGNWQISAGRQSLDWGPGLGGSLLWSTNAEPVDMVRIVNPQPERLPGVFKFLGPARVDQFIGQLVGHPFTPHPYVYGQKISFKPFSSLEIGFGRTTTIGGRGADPLTPTNFMRSFFGLPGAHSDSVPGDSHTSMDWTWNLPGTAHYLVFYGEVYADDDLVAWVNPAKNPFHPGIYLTHLPGISKAEFHVEATSTESPGWNAGNMGNLNYWNASYHDGYTNDGNLLGSSVGRMGQAIQCWMTYWASPATVFELSYKNSRVDKEFITGGGAWQDYGARLEKRLLSGMYLKTGVQYEHISRYPLLFAHAGGNVTATVELGFAPQRKK